MQKVFQYKSIAVLFALLLFMTAFKSLENWLQGITNNYHKVYTSVNKIQVT